MSDEETEIEYEHDMSRDEIADHLESVADTLRGTDEFDIEIGGDTVTINPPETVEFEVELEDEEEEGEVERTLEFELEWARGDDEDPLPDSEA